MGPGTFHLSGQGCDQIVACLSTLQLSTQAPNQRLHHCRSLPSPLPVHQARISLSQNRINDYVDTGRVTDVS